MSEYTPVVFRPIATASVQFSISVGQLLANVAIKAFGELESHWAYRGPFAVQLPFCLFLVAGLPFSPETPCYLVRRGKRDQAKASLARLYGKGSRDDIETKVCALENTLAEEGNKDASLSSIMLCFRGTNRIRTMISTFVFLGLHCTGTICIVGYSTYFFQLAGLPTLGRRKIYVSGIFCLTALLFTIGIIDVIPSGAGKTVEAASTVAFAFIYTFTVGSCAFAILGEVSSVSLRAPTVALATGMQAFCGITFNLIIPYMMNPDQGNLKGKVGFIFGVSALCAGVWSFFFVPDLEGRSFNDIDRMFVARVPPRKMGSYKLKG
ncbi:maltose permease [Purpureocillium lilacinum]|uniref:Maltose permease n=1 Tax=Purpureocillium lilacinum TaxID=33203 RepID=A0A179GU89_PURLI|nr:maltose permease [Purpureocillium lilacinum]